MGPRTRLPPPAEAPAGHREDATTIVAQVANGGTQGGGWDEPQRVVAECGSSGR